ncbi:MAG: TonB family protein [Longimicrobiales bacterium]
MTNSAVIGLSASEQLRGRWEAYVSRATAAAVVAHATVFALSPAWQVSQELMDPMAAGSDAVLLVSYGDGSSTEQLLSPVPTILGDADPAGVSATGQEVPLVTDAEVAALWDALGDQTRRGRIRLPALAEPAVDPRPADDASPDEDGAPTEEDDTPSFESDAVLSDLAELPEPDSLQLDRLSALRPELAFMSASAWVLIRNQAEVEAYLRRSYREGLLDESATGSVSVTLWIDRRGSVEWAEISKSSGRPDLDEFTLALFNEVADFRAARERGLYISRSVTFSVNYPW